MLPTTLFTLVAAATVSGYPGMDRVLADIQRRDDSQVRSTSLLGDLGDIANDVLTEVGSEIKAVLEGAASAMADDLTYTPPGEKDSDACKEDKCCIWSYIVADMVTTFTNGTQCSGAARGAIRLGFHDAGAWNSSLSFGGADGSILLSGELSRSENSGLQRIANLTTAWFNTYKDFGISMADLIQVGAMVGTVVCPLGPRIKTFVGRKDDATPPPEGLMPSVFQEAPELIDLFTAKTFTAADLVALVGAHSVSRQFTVDETKLGAPQDSTDGIWDTKFYDETASDETPEGVFKFPSDVSLAKEETLKELWDSFSGPAGQQPWNFAYAPAYFRMSLLGVKNLNELIDCTKVLPLPR